MTIDRSMFLIFISGVDTINMYGHVCRPEDSHRLSLHFKSGLRLEHDSNCRALLPFDTQSPGPGQWT